MTDLRCINCRSHTRDVRLVEHGTNDMALCGVCFGHIKREFDNRGADIRVRCDDCGGTIARTLVETDGKADVRLACGCYVYEPTRSHHVPVTNDIPDKWCKSEAKPSWNDA